MRTAERHFLSGEFTEAGRLFHTLADDHPSDPHVLLRCGQLDLFGNRIVSAIDFLERCASSGGDVDVLLAEAHYRAGQFAAASTLYAEMGRDALARHLATFADTQPYRVETDAARTTIEFLVREPLPMLRVLVNGHEEALFVVDTGAWDTVLDRKLAERAGVARGRLDRVTFAGGRVASVQYGRLDSLDLGDLTIADLPVQIMELEATLAGFFDPHGIDGILGLGVLSHFSLALDMRQGWLRLLRGPLELKAAIPCWFGGGRQLLAWGDINSQPTLWFIDTGMMGFDCLVPPSTAAYAQLDHGAMPVQGYGGGGQLTMTSASVRSLRLGEFRKAAARGVISAEFNLERQYGYHMGGMLSVEFFREACLLIDFSTMRLAVRGDGINPAEC